MFLQEAMDLVSRTEFEQPPDLRFRELAGTIALQRQALKGRPRDAGSSGLKMASDILRQVERDLHGWLFDAITLYQPATPPDSDWGLPAVASLVLVGVTKSGESFQDRGNLGDTSAYEITRDGFGRHRGGCLHEVVAHGTDALGEIGRPGKTRGAGRLLLFLLHLHRSEEHTSELQSPC